MQLGCGAAQLAGHTGGLAALLGQLNLQSWDTQELPGQQELSSQQAVPCRAEKSQFMCFRDLSAGPGDGEMPSQTPGSTASVHRVPIPTICCAAEH